MRWIIPEPFIIPPVKPLRWQGWWRGFSLGCIAVLLLGCGGYFWLKDPRLLLYTFGLIVGMCLLFGMLAGWKMYRFGVEAEHADGVVRLNLMNEQQWQRWAQQSVPVLGFHAVFPSMAHTPDSQGEPVNIDAPLTLPVFDGMASLFDELLLPLLPELHALSTQRIPLEVTLPESCGSGEWQQFISCWSQAGLNEHVLLPPVFGAANCSAEIWRRCDAGPSASASLLIVRHLDDSHAATEGVIAWLLGPGGQNRDTLPVRCSLHRPMQASLPPTEDDIQQFLRYQPLTMAMSGLWSDAMSHESVDTMMMAYSQNLKQYADNDYAQKTPPLPVQHYLPHWLGKTGPRHDWFTLTLMMQMTQSQPGVQSTLIAQDGVMIFISVSTGAFTDDK